MSWNNYGKILNQDFDPALFREQLERSEHSVLFLDYDGTLSPFRPERDKAIPYDGVREIIAKLLSLENDRLVIVSGRSVNDLRPLLGLQPHPEIWGTHGMERLQPSGEYYLKELPPAAKRFMYEIGEWIKANGLQTQSEKKPGALAIHWRGLPEEQRNYIQQQILGTWKDRVERSDMLIKEFDGGLEFRFAGMDKGKAVHTVLSQLERNEVSCAYLGDDLTDEDAFAVIKDVGLAVLVRPELRQTYAHLWIKPPVQLLRFLNEWYDIRKKR